MSTSSMKHDRLYENESDDGIPVAGTELRKTAPTIYHMGIGVAFVFVLIAAIVSLGALASKHNEILGDCSYCGCILYSTYEHDHIEFSHGKTCAFAIWGEAVIAAIAVGFIVTAVVKVVSGKKIVGFAAAVELLIIILTTSLALIIGIVISAGLSQTCGALEHGNSVPCERHYFSSLGGKDVKVYIYKALNISQISAWIGVTFLVVITLIYSVVLIVSRVKKSNRFNPTPI